MTPPRQDTPQDPALSRLYQQHAVAEPPTALDQRILATARQELAPADKLLRNIPWWRRWQTPMALVITILLALPLTLLMEQQPPADLPSDWELPQPTTPSLRSQEQANTGVAPMAANPIAAAPMAAPQASSAIPGSTAQVPNQTASKLENAIVAPSPAATREAPPEAFNRARSIRPATVDQAVRPVSPPAEATAYTTQGALSAPPPQVVRLPPAPSDDSTEMSAENALARKALPVPPSPPPLAESRAISPSPEIWLEKIRKLGQTGQKEEAERQLVEFRKAHPDYPLPEEFRR